MANIQENIREAMTRGGQRALEENGYKTRADLLKEAKDLGFIEDPKNNARPQ